jgi:urocanate hydratase
MATNPNSPAVCEFTLQVERFYAGLMLAVKPDSASDCELGLGGKLLYVGELDEQARALLVAANIAGAATLVVSADAAARKQFMRDGVVDFLVTSLDEALRILKNEIRKRETVAVCVAVASVAVVADFAREMQERGVVPDLVRPGTADSLEGQTLLCWRVASLPAIWLPKLDAIALDCLEASLGAPGLDSETWDSARRWLRLAPHYMGRLAQGVRLLRCGQGSAANFIERMRKEVECGEIGVRVELRRSREGQSEQYSFAPLPRHD